MKKERLFGLAICTLMGCTAMAYETPTMGWSSWNAFGFKISDSIIKSQADALVETGLKEAGYIYLNIDDGFFGGRDSEGRLLIHPTRFPNGMRPVVDYIHARGLKAGIYSDAGENTCASYFGGDTIGVGVGLYGHDQEDIDLYFKELDFDFIKVDFCGGSPGHNADKLDLPEQERYTAIHQAILNTGRTDVRLNVCRWAFPGTWVHDVATSWRISEDIYLEWESIKSIVGQNLYLSAYATEGKYNDMDMLEVGRGLSTEEDKTHFGLWCIMSSPLLIGCDMTTISDEALSLMTNPELIALNQDTLGLQAYVVDKVSGTYLLVKDVETLYGHKRAMAIYNPTDAEVIRPVDFLSMDLGGKVAVRDLFAREDLGTYAAGMNITVPAHGTRICLLTAEQRYERTRYEAETAWLSAYQELYNNQSVESAIYEEATYCSGGAKAGWLGRRADNDLQWRHVYSREGGDYTLTLTYITGENRQVYLTVGDGEPQVLTLNSGGWSTPATVEVQVTLQQGDNLIRLYNPSAWMPDIDCMELVKTGSLEVYAHRLEAARGKVSMVMENEALPAGIRLALEEALHQTEAVEESREAYQTAVDLLTQACYEAEQSLTLYPQITALAAVCRQNVAAAVAGTEAEEFSGQIESAVASADQAQTAEQMQAALTALRTDATTFHTSATANPREGESWNLTFLLTNPTFDSTGTGWATTPTVRSGVGEFWNSSISMYQTVKAIKNGNYELRVQALYRTGENDGGAAYRAGTEIITAKLHAGTASARLASLYNYPYAGDTDGFSSLDMKNGYVNSMYAASVAFGQGQYWNVLPVTVSNNRLRIGLSCTSAKYDSWCCFDNFTLIYLGGDPATAIRPVENRTPQRVDVYSVEGVQVKTQVSRSEATEGLRRGIYIVEGEKVVK